jgi:hypothetical protein
MSGLKKLEIGRVVKVTAPCQQPVFRTVFFLDFKHYREVLKAERMLSRTRAGVKSHQMIERRNATRISFDNISALMESVMKAPVGRSCPDDELTQLRIIPAAKFESPKVCQKYFDCLDDEAYVMTRVEYLGGLQELGEGEDQLQRALTFKNALEKDNNFAQSLGKLIAMDLFLGNYDRFDYNGAIANVGNFFFRKPKVGRLKIVALDNFMDGSGHANLLRDHTRGAEEMSATDDPLKLTAFSASGSEQHLTQCVINLHAELFRIINGEPFANQGELFNRSSVGREMLAGFKSTVPDIKLALKARSKTVAGVPEQLRQRFEALETQLIQE